VAAFGVRVAIIEPGVIQTALFENSAGATRYDKNSPYRQIMRRNGKFFAAGFRNPGQPETVAAAILEAITTDRPRLRYPVGVDAEGIAAGRPRVSDEKWVAMGAGCPTRSTTAASSATSGSSSTGSVAKAKTMGMVVVAFLAATAAREPETMMTFGCSAQAPQRPPCYP
jgi:hypothetical protein